MRTRMHASQLQLFTVIYLCVGYGSFWSLAFLPRLSCVWQVIDGIDVLDVIEKAPVGKKERPTVDIVIKHVTIHANPIAENG